MLDNAINAINNPKAIGLLSKVILMAEKLGASDIHMRSGKPIMVRVDGSICKVKGTPIFEEVQLLTIMKGVLSPEKVTSFYEDNQIDASFTAQGGTRVRINMYRQLDRTAVVMRLIPAEILTVNELQLPKQLENIARLKRGLVIFAGATGSGKSTSMAAILDKINKIRSEHILTIEDPIEYLFKEDKCIISQREVGTDVPGFRNAIKGAMREDPDVILIGEMRDHTSIEMALDLAETGHLVFSTVHAPSSVDTISRIVSSFPGDAQRSIRNKLASNLEVVVSQRLVKRNPKGRVAACEIMTVTELVSELIMDEAKTHEIEDLMKGQDGGKGMLHFDEHLLELVKDKVITPEVALNNASSKTDLELKLHGF